jgi:hypothetical protein
LAWLAGGARRTWLAGGAWRSKIATLALRTELTSFAALATLTLPALGAVAQGRQAGENCRLQLAPQSRAIGAELGDRRPGMRLDQLDGALALPLLLGQHAAQRLAPSIN